MDSRIGSLFCFLPVRPKDTFVLVGGVGKTKSITNSWDCSIETATKGREYDRRLSYLLLIAVAEGEE